MNQKNKAFKASNFWIGEQIKILRDDLRSRDEAGFSIFHPDECFYKFPPREQAEIMLKRYGIPFEGIDFHMQGDLDEPGRVELRRKFDVSSISLKPGQSLAYIAPDGACDIFDMNTGLLIKAGKKLSLQKSEISFFVSQDFLGYPNAMASILAHEVTHLYRHFKNIRKIEEEKNEIEEYLTDITAFVIGLGEIMLNGCQTKRRITGASQTQIISRTTLGYLSPEQMQFAQKQVMAYI